MLNSIMGELDGAIIIVFVSNSLHTFCHPKFLGLSWTIIYVTTFVCPQKFSFSTTEDDKTSPWFNNIKEVDI